MCSFIAILFGLIAQVAMAGVSGTFPSIDGGTL